MTEAATHLDYARPAQQRRARWKLWISLTLLLCATAFVALRYGAEAFRDMRLARYRQQCMTYTAPPTQVVYTNDPAEASKLLASGAGYVSRNGRDAHFNPPAWRNFNAARHVSQPSDGTMFLHARSLPDGQRLIAHGGVVIQPESVVFAFSLCTQTATGGFMSRSRGEGVWIPVKSTDTFRVFAGQPDLTDATHLTFVYELNGQKHTVDAWVEDVATVRLEPRKVPETAAQD